MKRTLFILVVSVMLVMFSATQGFADSFLPPEPFEIWSEDGTTVFKWNPGQGDNLLATAQAGVYQNGELLYSVENLPIIGESARSFIFSENFRYLVFRPSVSQVAALGFFENGVLLQSYRIDELVRNMNVVTYSVAAASWENWSGRKFDTANNTLTIMTCDDITYVFDITTGEIIYDTVGETPFISPNIDGNAFGFFANEVEMPLCSQKSNNETPSSWAQESIERAGELGLLPEPFRSGFGRNTTRAEFAAIAIALYEHFGEPVTGRNTFTDTTDTNVEKSAYLGIVSGVGDNRFDPDSPLTREQAAVMLVRLAKLMGQPLAPSLPTFADNSQISSWAFDSVGQIQEAGIMSGIGDNRFAPQQPYTREQSIITALRIYEIVSDLNNFR